MQQSYTFGLNAEPLQTPTATDFLKLTNQAGSAQNHNPYGTSYFNDPAMMAMTEGSDRVTSIPSPYARMHITDIAFREMMAGNGNQQAHFNSMSGDYLRAMSHCLDIYEMMFRFNQLDLIDKGVTVKKIDLVTGNDARYQDLLSKNGNLKKFVETLDLFRRSYMQTIRGKAPQNYHFDFTKLYIFKHQGRTFASTSPFTGFFAKADCDLTNAGLAVTWEQNGQRKEHRLLTNTPNEWLSIQHRAPAFIEFLYLLLRDTGLDRVFCHLAEAVKACVPNAVALQNVMFSAKYPEFNFNNLVLPQIAGNMNVSYIRPDGLDCSYLEYLLYLREPVDLAISEKAYQTSIQNRVFPEGSTNLVPWIGVNDFLSDALFILPYDINENYYAIEYEDEHLHRHRRCLLPLKRQALEYLDINTVANKLFVKKYSKGHYSVTLTLDLTTGGKVELRRDYYDINEEECAFPNGALKDLQDDDRHFAFGIYPFVRSDRFKNIYKVLFYNDFKWPEGFTPKPTDVLYGLDFYYLDQNNRAQKYDTRTSVVENQTNKADDFFNVNTHYYHVADNKQVNGNYICINFAEMSLTLVKNPKSGNPKLITATAIIAPVYHDVALKPGTTTNIAVDLGTSNTFIAYQHEGGAVREISTIHKQPDWNEFTLMNCTCQDPSAIAENRDDLYLRTTDDPARNADNVCLAAQLCEFVPTRIKQSSDQREYGYHFPIPSVINNLRINGETSATFTDRIALVHSAIPFAYYTIGQRKNNSANTYDAISTGQFKWFYGKDDYGMYSFDKSSQANFEAFLRELMFIVRSHMLCQGYDLDQCRLIWTYPLSFQDPLVQQYKAAWDKVYCQYFNPSLLDTSGNISDWKALDNVVKYTNESRSPIYECIQNPALTNHLTVLMDIGGGSTDVIGYKKNQPEFITSFGFAGNALYLGGSMNHSVKSNNGVEVENYMRASVKKLVDNRTFENRTGMGGTHPIDPDVSDINTLMNFGFSQDPVNFNALFNSNHLQFMLQFHNAALIYQTAQLCKIKSPDEMPVAFFLTGNGSKLFFLNKSYKDLFTSIVSTVYGQNAKFSISTPNDPKAATAFGSLKGSQMTDSSALKFNEDSTNKQVVMLGDDSSILDMDQNDGSASVMESQNVLLDKVKANVKKFIDVFYQCFKGQAPVFSKEEMLEMLDFGTDGDSKLNFGAQLSDSMFFQYISLLMEQMSIRICQKYNL